MTSVHARVRAKSLHGIQLCATLWTVALQAPLSMRFSRQEYWSGLPCPTPRDLPNPGIGPRSPVLQVDSFQSEARGKLFFSTTLAYPHQERKGKSSWGNQQPNWRGHTLLVNARQGRGGGERQRDKEGLMSSFPTPNSHSIPVASERPEKWVILLLGRMNRSQIRLTS